MYSYEDRLKAVELYIKNNFRMNDTLRELGYTNRMNLRRWYLEYQRTGTLHKKTLNAASDRKYSREQKETAVAYYLEHGRNLTWTVEALGYPSLNILRSWIDLFAPGKRKINAWSGKNPVQFSLEQKMNAAIKLCTRKGTANDVAKEIGVSKHSLYRWKKELLDKK